MWTVVVWWLWIEVIGLAVLPLAFRFFRGLPDRGYAFARPLGLLLTSYVLWLGASLGLLRNSTGGALFSLVAVAIASLVVYQRGHRQEEPGLWAWLRANRRLVVTVELLFAAAFALWALIRAYSPELTTSGGEKFMEIMYLNSIGRSDYFPPQDAWLSGYAISYYYFGYVMMAMLTRLSGFAAHLTFNVGEALLFAMTCTGAFGIVYNLVKRAEGTGSMGAEEPSRSARPFRPLAFGFLGAVLVAIMGNLEGFLEVLYSARLLPAGFWRWLDILGINQPFNTATAASLMPTRSGWWWWQASRVINDLDPLGKPMGIEPIDEFPGFSFLLGDMHPHVLALPFVLLALAVALRALLGGWEDNGSDAPDRSGGLFRQVRSVSLLIPLSLGALGFLNTWDFPIYLLLFVVAYGLGQWPRYGRLGWPFLRNVLVTGGTTAILGVVLYLPFYIGLQSQAGGLLPTLYVGTRFRQYFVMFGPFLVAIAGLMTVLVLRVWRQARRTSLLGGWLRWTAALLLVPSGIMLLVALMVAILPQGRTIVDEIRSLPYVQEIAGSSALLPLVGRLLLVKLRTWVMPLVVAALAALGVALIRHGSAAHVPPLPQQEEADEEEGTVLRQPAVQFVLVCAVVGLLLTLSVEFVYLVDVFRVRMNTIFKFYFQAWVLMAIASSFAVYWLSRMKNRMGTAFLAGFWLLFAMGMVYPILGNVARAGNFEPRPTLDGTAYLAASEPDDYAAITWLNEQVGDAPVILETPGSGGSSYVYEGRVSALTGLPTLVGWAGHEGQWRGNYDVQSARDPDIQTIYSSLDSEAALTLLYKYDISYVYVGPLERSKYDPRALAKFEYFMDVVYQNDGVTIYKVRK